MYFRVSVCERGRGRRALQQERKKKVLETTKKDRVAIREGKKKKHFQQNTHTHTKKKNSRTIQTSKQTKKKQS